MRKTVLILLIQIISVISFAFSEGREICNTVGTTTNCEIEGIIIPVTLEVPKSIYIVKENKTIDFDFGEVIKGENKEVVNSFKIKGDVDSKIILRIYQSGEKTEKIVLSNSENTINLIPEIEMKSAIENEMFVDMRLKLNGVDTVNLSAGEYTGVFTVRAILAGRE